MQVPALAGKLTSLPPMIVQPQPMQPIHQPLHNGMPADVTNKTAALARDR